MKPPLNLDLTEITDKIVSYLDRGVEAVGFVSPSHQIPHVKAIIENLHRRQYYPVTVFNTNAYDKAEILKDLEGIIDVYLPDFKYFNPDVAASFSDARNYPEIACTAISEMYRQKGSTVVVNENGQAVTGLIIRHLVLPGQSKEAVRILEWIASELSPSVHISLMSQYYPTNSVIQHPLLGRKITMAEYEEVTEAMDKLGFYRGWIQEFDSPVNYQPDFTKLNPFY
jgi:putative pyruvate formate lyase activating enzyme